MQSLPLISRIVSNLVTYPRAAHVDQTDSFAMYGLQGTVHDLHKGCLSDRARRRTGCVRMCIAGNYDDPVSRQNILPAIPVTETFPVVLTYNENELASGISCAESVKGGNHVAGTRKGELDVGDLNVIVTCKRDAGKTETKVVVPQAIMLQRVARTDDKPHLSDYATSYQLACKCSMTCMYGAETATIYACDYPAVYV